MKPCLILRVQQFRMKKGRRRPNKLLYILPTIHNKTNGFPRTKWRRHFWISCWCYREDYFNGNSNRIEEQAYIYLTDDEQYLHLGKEGRKNNSNLARGSICVSEFDPRMKTNIGEKGRWCPSTGSNRRWGWPCPVQLLSCHSGAQKEWVLSKVMTFWCVDQRSASVQSCVLLYSHHMITWFVHD